MKRLMTGCIMAALILSCVTVSASARHGCMDTVCGGFSIGCGPAVCVSQERVRLHSCVAAAGPLWTRTATGSATTTTPTAAPETAWAMATAAIMAAGGITAAGTADTDICAASRRRQRQ